MEERNTEYKKSGRTMVFYMVLLGVLVAVTAGGIRALKNARVLTEGENFVSKIVIDAGHGGEDPGKIGINGAKEKDINLSIAVKLAELLEKENIEVVLTREGDVSLKENEQNRFSKQADMRKRVETINESDAGLAVSIHQNSFTEESSHGAQVFYHTNSEAGKNFAMIMQDTIKSSIADGNHREAKSNDSYYLLKNTECPLIIIECGFLSNPAEADLLLREDYQEKMAEAIKNGIMEYLSEGKQA